MISRFYTRVKQEYLNPGIEEGEDKERAENARWERLLEIAERTLSLIHIFYYAGFSSQFIENINLMKSTQHLLPIIVENPVINLSPLQACSYKMFYESLILAYASRCV